jgi:hypothetical protein
MRHRLSVVIAICALLTVGRTSAQELQDMLFALDAARSEIGRFDAENGALVGAFPTPVFCRPEGACGLAFTGYSLYFVDSTDPDQKIYEISPIDGTLWNSFAAPDNSIDGLAFDEDALYAASFGENRIYRLDPIDGSVLESLEIDADLVGGLGVGDGGLFAGSIRPGTIFSIDPANGQILNSFATPGALPTGLALLGGKLFVGDAGEERLYRLNPESGAVEEEWALAGVNIAGLASGQGIVAPPYELRVELVTEEQPSREVVEFTLRAGLYSAGGKLLQGNDASELTFALITGEGDWLDGSVKRVVGGEATAVLSVPVGKAAEVEVELAGLEPGGIRLGATARTSEIVLRQELDGTDPKRIALVAELFDIFGALNQQDDTEVVFEIARGSGVLIGSSIVVPEEGVARTWVRLLDEQPGLVVRVRQGEAQEETSLEESQGMPAAKFGGLSVSSQPVAGRDEKPPEPPLEVRAEKKEDQVEVSWQLSATDQGGLWYPLGNQMVYRPLVKGYRIFRSQDDGLYEEVGQVAMGEELFVDALPEETGTYRYKVVAEDGENFSEVVIVSGSEADDLRSVVVGPGVPVDEEGVPVLGLFGEDLQVGFDDFFLFADNFGMGVGVPGFDARYDMNDSGGVDFDDFFIFADNFGRVAVSGE